MLPTVEGKTGGSVGKGAATSSTASSGEKELVSTVRRPGRGRAGKWPQLYHLGFLKTARVVWGKSTLIPQALCWLPPYSQAA